MHFPLVSSEVKALSSPPTIDSQKQLIHYAPEKNITEDIADWSNEQFFQLKENFQKDFEYFSKNPAYSYAINNSEEGIKAYIEKSGYFDSINTQFTHLYEKDKSQLYDVISKRN
jgi:hypothetical protein